MHESGWHIHRSWLAACTKYTQIAVSSLVLYGWSATKRQHLFKPKVDCAIYVTHTCSCILLVSHSTQLRFPLCSLRIQHFVLLCSWCSSSIDWCPAPLPACTRLAAQAQPESCLPLSRSTGKLLTPLLLR